MKLALAGALLLALAVPAVAQSGPPATCYPLDQLVKDLEAAGAKVVGVASYAGTMTDELLVVQSETAISIVGFKDGCYVGDMQLEPAVPQKDA